MKYNNVNDFKEEIISLYQKGVLKKDIREQLNISESALTKFFKENTIYKFREDAFENIDSEEKAYWLGFLWADGYCKSGIDIELTDEDHIIKLKEFLKINNKIIQRNRNNSTTFRLNCNSKKLANDLVALGFDLKDNRINIPNIKDELLRHFIRGYFDGDGCITGWLAIEKGKSDRVRYSFDICGKTESLLTEFMKVLIFIILR